MPKVSIIIPIYNVSDYISKCLDSIINQTLADIEIICVDDGSTDKSLEIVKGYEENDKRVKIVTQENQGAGIARNSGIKIATGEYIGFVDPDDWVDSNMFEVMYNKAKKRDADIVECDFRICFEKSNKKKNRLLFNSLKTIWKIPILFGIPFKWSEIKHSVFKGLRAMVWNRIYRREMIIQNKVVFPAGKGEDYPFSIDAVISANKIVHCGKVLYNYLIRANSLSYGGCSNLKMCENHPAIIKDILNKHNLFKEFEVEYRRYCFYTYSNEYLSREENLVNEYKKYFSESEFSQFKSWIERKRKNGNNSFLERIFSVKSKTVNGNNIKEIMILNKKYNIQNLHTVEVTQ